MPWFLWLAAGFFVGGIVGFVLMSLLAMSGATDMQDENDRLRARLRKESEC